MTSVGVCHFYLLETCLTQQPINLGVSERSGRWSLLVSLSVSVCVCVPAAGLRTCQAVLPNSSLAQGLSLPSFLSPRLNGLSIPLSSVTAAAAEGDKAVVRHQLHLFPHAQPHVLVTEGTFCTTNGKLESLICFPPTLLALNYFGFCIFAHIRPATVDSFSPVSFNRWNICANSSSTSVIYSSRFLFFF